MNETKTEWRDCADPDELAAAVAAGVEVEVQRRVGQPWQPTRSIDAAQFAGFISTGHRYRLPTSWTWHQEPPAPDGVVAPEPPAPDEVAAPDDDWCEAVLNDLNSIIHGHCGSDGSDDAHCDWVNDLANEVVRYFQRQDVLAVLPTPLPVPPWPGAVPSGLTDEDGEPTWLAQAGQVRGEQVRSNRRLDWTTGEYCSKTGWVEVRAPRAVPEPETERVDALKVLRDRSYRVVWMKDHAAPACSIGPWNDDVAVWSAAECRGYVQPIAPDGTVEVLKDGGQ